MMLRRLPTILLALISIHPVLADEPEKPDPFKGIKFRNIGPSIGGRVCRACGVPGDPFTYYAATAGGGVWKASDGGLTWKPLFHDQPVSRLGRLAVAPSDPNVIFLRPPPANTRGHGPA